MRARRQLLGIAAAATLLWTSGPLRGQVVRGQVAEAGGRPVPGVLIRLLDPAGAVRAEALSDPAGEFLLRAPEPGVFRLRADRIGYAAVISAAMALAEADTASTRLTLPVSPVALPEISATARPRCAAPSGAETARLWEEANRALRATEITREQRLYRYRVRRELRVLDPEFLTVRTAQTRTFESEAETPFTSVPVEVLRTHGFLQAAGDTLLFHAPDAAVLLSDYFMETHCFSARAPDREHVGLVGLAFEPTRRDRARTEVAGVLWLEPATAELRLLEYRYVDPPLAVPADLAGGRIEFRRLPNGAWIIPSWTIRMPMRSIRIATLPPGASRPSLTLREEVGQVSEVIGPDGVAVEMAAFAALTGVVWDSTRAAPLAGARISLTGTEHAAVADSMGAYRIERVSAGSYLIDLTHPRLDSLHYRPEPVRVTLAPPQVTELRLAVPPLAALRAAACPPSPDGWARASGQLTAPGGRPVAGAAVRAVWDGSSAGTTVAASDAYGVYRFCALPEGLPVRITARVGGDSVSVEVVTRAETTVDGSLQFSSGVAPPAAAATGPTEIRGHLVDAGTGRPVVGATVKLDADSAGVVTDRRGGFAIPASQGGHTLRVHHPAYGTAASRVTTPSSGPLEVVLRLPRRTLSLEPIVVRAQRVLPGEYDVRRRGRRLDLITREQIERSFGVATSVGHLAARIPGLKVRESSLPGAGVCIESVTAGAPDGALGTRTTECAPVLVALDDVIIADPMSFVNSIPVSGVESIIYLKPSEAVVRFGLSGGRGVLLIYTRGNGPTVAREFGDGQE